MKIIFCRKLQRLNNIYIYIYMALIEENGKKNHDTKIIRNFVEGLNKVIYEF